MDAKRLISHSCDHNNLDQSINELSDAIKQQGNTEHFTVQQRLAFLHQLSQSDFGRFLIIHRGINGYWTHYMLTYPWFKPKVSSFEHQMLSCPLMKATQQRFQIFLQQNQTMVNNNATLACVPSGLMGELLYLNVDSVEKINLVGIDYDPDTLHDAQVLADKKNLDTFVTCLQTDAWQMQQQNDFDLISSNGLNIYEANDRKVTELYRRFHSALKPGGKLVTSFLTPPPTLTNQCEWQFDRIDAEQLLWQKAIFADTLQAKWQCYRSTETTRQQLIEAGFININVIYDDAHLFPTVTAFK